MTAQPVPRVVFDTNTVISALVFTAGRLAWLRLHWRERGCVVLVSRATARELIRVLNYSKFRLSPERSLELQSDYFPYSENVVSAERCAISCRDPKDQCFLDLAHCGKADVLVTGDDDLLSLAAQTAFAIETPDAYRLRVSTSRLL
ncbi:MAG: putative toxin-antitoxin system toxin component, PIN family [Terracidiphilus sp.]|jgi:putative PIN family toxin of toxin-antitoxin system